EPVACAANRVNQLRLEIVVDLSTKSSYQDLQDVRKRVVIVVPDMSGDRRAIDHLPLVPSEKLEQSKFFRGQSDLSLRTLHLAGLQIDSESRDLNALGSERRLATRQRANPCEELAESERLREIIVGARLESAHAVVDRVPRRQHQDGRGNAAGTNLRAEI